MAFVFLESFKSKSVQFSAACFRRQDQENSSSLVLERTNSPVTKRNKSTIGKEYKRLTVLTVHVTQLRTCSGVTHNAIPVRKIMKMTVVPQDYCLETLAIIVYVSTQCDIYTMTELPIFLNVMLSSACISLLSNL